MLNPPGDSSEISWQRPVALGRGEMAMKRRGGFLSPAPAGRLAQDELCSSGYEIPEAKGRVRQAAGKDYGRSSRRLVCLCRVPGTCAYHGEELNEMAFETPFSSD